LDLKSIKKASEFFTIDFCRFNEFSESLHSNSVTAKQVQTYATDLMKFALNASSTDSFVLRFKSVALLLNLALFSHLKKPLKEFMKAFITDIQLKAGNHEVVQFHAQMWRSIISDSKSVALEDKELIEPDWNKLQNSSSKDSLITNGYIARYLAFHKTNSVNCEDLSWWITTSTDLLEILSADICNLFGDIDHKKFPPNAASQVDMEIINRKLNRGLLDIWRSRILRGVIPVRYYENLMKAALTWCPPNKISSPWIEHLYSLIPQISLDPHLPLTNGEGKMSEELRDALRSVVDVFDRQRICDLCVSFSLPFEPRHILELKQKQIDQEYISKVETEVEIMKSQFKAELEKWKGLLRKTKEVEAKLVYLERVDDQNEQENTIRFMKRERTSNFGEKLEKISSRLFVN
jgi:hypothetical protein